MPVERQLEIDSTSCSNDDEPTNPINAPVVIPMNPPIFVVEPTNPPVVDPVPVPTNSLILIPIPPVTTAPIIIEGSQCNVLLSFKQNYLPVLGQQLMDLVHCVRQAITCGHAML